MPGVIFITAYEHYALDAFDAGAIDYLHKPVSRPRFAVAVGRARERLQQRSAADLQALLDGVARVERTRGARSRFVVRRGNVHVFVPVGDIDWLDAADNYLRLHVSDRTHLTRGTMTQAEEELDPARFVRIHRSAIVAVDRIVAIRSHDAGGYVVELRSGVRLRTSRQYGDRVRALLR